MSDRRPPSSSPKKDFASDQEVRWCPGCGDYAILAQVQKRDARAGHAAGELRLHLGDRLLQPLPVLHEHLRLSHASTAARRPSPPGSRSTRPELQVWVVTGDGDALSHRRQPPDPRPAAQRRPQDPAVQQPDLRADQGAVLADLGAREGDQVHARGLARLSRSTRSSLAIGAEATFVARIDRRRSQAPAGPLAPRHEHKGAAFIEILQNCNVFNDGAWAHLTDKDTKADAQLRARARQAAHLRQEPRSAASG